MENYLHFVTRFENMSLGGIPVFLTYLVRFAHGNFSKNVSFIITYCLLRNNILDTVEKHLVRDHGQEPQFTCEICGSKIIHHKDFQQHMKSHRNPERKCPLCPLKFITKGYYYIIDYYVTLFIEAIQSHMVRDHGHQRQYSCEICGIQFIRQNYYRKHMNRHEKNPDKKIRSRSKFFR